MESRTVCEVLDSPGTNEHPNRLCGCLNCDSDAHDESTEEHRSTTANSISEVWSKRVAGERAYILKQ